jgi:hypothetical protein
MHPTKKFEREASDLKKVMLLLAMLAMVLAAVAPAFAQSASPGAGQTAVGGSGDDVIQQCQNNLNQTNFSFASGDVSNANINTGDLINNCTQIVNNTNIFDDGAKKVVGFTKFEGVHKTVFFNVEKNFFFIIVENEVVVVEKNVIVFTVDVHKKVIPVTSTVTQEVPTKVVTATTTTTATAPVAAAPTELPPTGGASVIALGVGVLLVAGGLLARRIVR